MGKIKFRTKMLMIIILMFLIGIFSIIFAKNGMRDIETKALSTLETYISETGADTVDAEILETEKSAMETVVAQEITSMTRIMIVMMIIVGAIVIFITYDMVHSLNYACSYSDTLSEGDLTDDISDKYADRKDTVGELAASFAKIKNNLHSLIGNIQRNRTQRECIVH